MSQPRRSRTAPTVPVGKASHLASFPVSWTSCTHLVLSPIGFTTLPAFEIIQTSQSHPPAGIRGTTPSRCYKACHPQPLLAHSALKYDSLGTLCGRRCAAPSSCEFMSRMNCCQFPLSRVRCHVSSHLILLRTEAPSFTSNVNRKWSEEASAWSPWGLHYCTYCFWSLLERRRAYSTGKLSGSNLGLWFPSCALSITPNWLPGWCCLETVIS